MKNSNEKKENKKSEEYQQIGCYKDNQIEFIELKKTSDMKKPLFKSRLIKAEYRISKLEYRSTENNIEKRR